MSNPDPQDAEPAAEALSARLSAFISESPLAAAMFDRQMRYVAWSRQWALDHGADGSGLQGRCYHEELPDLPPQFRKAIAQALAGESTSCEAERYQYPSGRTVWERRQVQPVLNTGGAVAGAVVWSQQVTDPGILETASRDRFLQAMDATGIGVLELDYRTGLVKASDGFLSLLAIGEQDIPKTLTGWAKVLRPADQDAFRAMSDQALDPNGNGLISSELRPLVSGCEKHLQVFGKVFFNGKGKGARPEHFVCLLIDQTKRQQLQAALAKAQRLETVGQLAGVIAHDFNNLLSIILANLELAALRVPGGDAQDFLKRAIDAAEAGGNFNAKLLALTGENGRNPEVLQLDSHILKTWAMLEHLLNESTTLRFLPGADGCYVRVDPPELDGAVINLVINARDAQPDGGRIDIRTADVSLDEAAASRYPDGRPGEYVRLSVSDRGTGMTEDVRKRALEPFFTTKGSGLGTGLGLASVAAAAARAEGFVHISSEPGQGTSVSLFLPAAGRQAAGPQADQKDIQFGNGELVLVVEDDPRVREATLQRLEAIGYAVTEAADAATALKQLSEGEPVDLVFSDVVMPGGMSGYGLAAEVRRLFPEVAVLLTSGYLSRAVEAALEMDNRPELLRKPYTLKVLAQAVSRALRTVQQEE
ncbi:ATP-binding protein [Leisingera sp. McT4-56]|uniref:ATP-binding protein n=1 Tax=Leisingera sp. McT4-56 TaxID=2881255 RepID=UPI001CF89035|nr:ATP-binding protein [Leisingera sp. McT4-56]MCB4457875.1 response regulator [Leisingera sp. McT4-56]